LAGNVREGDQEIEEMRKDAASSHRPPELL